MGKFYCYLQHTFIAFNVLFAMLGGFLIYGAISNSAIIDEMSGDGSAIWGWLFAFSFFSISCLGICAGYTEKEILLKIFAGFMVVGMIIMLIFGSITFDARNKVLSSPGQTYAQEKVEVMFNFIMGLYFGFAVIALLGLLVSYTMIHQVRRRDSSGGTSIAMKDILRRPLTPDL